MLNNTFILAAALTASAVPALAAQSQTVPVVSLFEFGKRSPINLNENFREVPETTISVEACTFDRHTATIHGIVMTNKTEAEATKLGGLPVKNFRRDLQMAYANALVHYNSKELEQDKFMPGNFKDFGPVFSDVTRALKASTNITMVFMPRNASVSQAVNPDCPSPSLKK